ncbi:DUF6611 family protein [Mycobacterium sp.]|uniref:DUF6611 family protein n=1 Tax=Mycobacterium sp. TaxID=1785 RepID=UPI0025CC8A4F|nr:DUF6611 family protein [Mycobacterium sp.]MBW0013728.1 hypothetical protein [Mycobacterium sp.]
MRRTGQLPGEAGLHKRVPTALSGPRWWARLLDGAHPWGFYDAAVGRYGVRRYRLIVYPPGSTAADRRLARLWRGWPTTGAVLALVAVLSFGDVVASPGTVLEYAVATYVGVGALLFLRAGPTRVRVRTMWVIVLPEGADVRELCKYAEWRMLVHMLTMADRMLASGAISVVQHEATWWKAYDRLGAISHV